jgi:phosphatidylserine/phosphatidylglycerophosphate/cardiolipin synthase-like enzyme
MNDPENLNDLRIRRSLHPSPPVPYYPQEDYSIHTPQIDVLFRNLEDHLVAAIQRADAVFGCVAWLTSERVLAEFAKKKDCCIVVNKEDFLRPDIGDAGDWKERVRRQYGALQGTHILHHRQSILDDLWTSMKSYGRFDGVRCVGPCNKERNRPRLHHKYIVLCKRDEHVVKHSEDHIEDVVHIEPYSVWTGSFNFSRNATLSLENAVVIREPSIVEAYYSVWQQTLALSESLDWKSMMASPEYYINQIEF